MPPSFDAMDDKHNCMITCSRDQRNELIAVECEALTGGRPDAWGIARGRVDHVHRGAFLKIGMQLLAQADGLEQLVSRVADLALDQDEFRIEWLHAGSPQDRRWEATIAIADQIHGDPNLTSPRHRFFLVADESRMSFGRVVSEASRTYSKHDRKPCHTPSSLPSQLARCLINLVASDAQSIVDPCCGTGSILLEAASAGLAARGGDWNPRMVAMSRQNAESFGYQIDIGCIDARQWPEAADAVVTDLPYGRGLEVSEKVLRQIISQAHAIAPVAVFVAGADVSQWLTDAGYCFVETYRLLKSRGFSRYIHRARREGEGDNAV
jgi:tRNA G10  N-methylase Trm11